MYLRFILNAGWTFILIRHWIIRQNKYLNWKRIVYYTNGIQCFGNYRVVRWLLFTLIWNTCNRFLILSNAPISFSFKKTFLWVLYIWWLLIGHFPINKFNICSKRLRDADGEKCIYRMNLVILRIFRPFMPEFTICLSVFNGKYNF